MCRRSSAGYGELGGWLAYGKERSLWVRGAYATRLDCGRSGRGLKNGQEVEGISMGSIRLFRGREVIRRQVMARALVAREVPLATLLPLGSSPFSKQPAYTGLVVLQELG